MYARIGLGILASAGLLAIAWGIAFGPPTAIGEPDLVWGQRGVRDGDLARPRAATITGDGRLWIVDFTARIQAFDLDGNHLGITFTPPDFRNGRPSGLGIDNRGRLVVADSHYHTVRVYEPDGTEVLHFGGPNLFGYVSDAVQDADGFWFVSEFGTRDRITKLAADGTVVQTWGESGGNPGQFNRVRALALGPDGQLYVADACNHRIQVFTRGGEWVRTLGGPGSEPGRFTYPYDLAFGPDGNLYVVERGNQRVQKLSPTGESLGSWGRPGSRPGELADPWALVVDLRGRIHVVDTENHRIQRIRW